MDFDIKDGGFSYLDCIPFKISSAFLPPPPVVLPALLSSENDELLSFEKFQYDFSKEKEILEDIRSREESVRASPLQDSGKKSSVQNIFSLQSDILLPKPQKILDKVSLCDGVEQNNSKINLSDFENDTSSPFDYMELQTINDLEELSNVFQGLNNKYSSEDNVYKEAGGESSVSKSLSFPLQNTDSFETSERYLMCGASLMLAHPVPPTTNDLTEENLARTFTSTSSPKVPSSVNGLSDLAAKSPLLRGCRSYSDIYNLSEGPENSPRQERSCTPPPPETFAAVEMKSTSVHPSEDGVVNCDNSSTLPDPYNELAEGDRKFVDAIAGMGFPRAQVSRSVKHLGSDEKTVVEHLCQIQMLEESGYDCLEAEAALHLHDYNQDQAKQFLDLINKFQDLGFEKNAVKKALIQNKNDWSKTIDALLS